MSSKPLEKDEYLRQAARNEELVLLFEKKFPSGHFFRWLFVIIYYTAYYYFCSFLIKKGFQVPDRHIGNSLTEGDVDMADNRFYTEINGRVDACGGQYRQLFDWSCSVRYNPTEALLLNRQELKVALDYLHQIKEISKQEVGFVYKKRGNKFKKLNA